MRGYINLRLIFSFHTDVHVYMCWFFLDDSGVKKSTCHFRRYRRCGFNPWVGKIPWRRKWQPTPVFLPGESHGQRSLAGYSPRGCEGSDTTKHSMQTHMKCMYICTYRRVYMCMCIHTYTERELLFSYTWSTEQFVLYLGFRWAMNIRVNVLRCQGGFHSPPFVDRLSGEAPHVRVGCPALQCPQMQHLRPRIPGRAHPRTGHCLERGHPGAG